MQTLQSGLTNLAQKSLENAELSTVCEVAGDTVIETGVSAIPIVGSALASYRMNKKIANTNILVEELRERINILDERSKNAHAGDKEKYIDLIDFAFESVESYSQQEKITYLADGLVAVINNDNLSYDIAYLYINTLNRLTLLDLAIVKLFNNNPYLTPDTVPEFNNYTDILEKFNISYEQYRAVQKNLYTLGILETKTDNSIEDDLDEITKQLNIVQTNVKIIHDDIDKMLSGKTIRKASKLTSKSFKLKSKDSYILSKFGRDFYHYFIKA